MLYLRLLVQCLFLPASCDAVAGLLCLQAIAACPAILPDLQRCLSTNFLCPSATQVYHRILAIIW